MQTASGASLSDATPLPTSRPDRRRGLLVALVAVTGVVYVADQATKALAVAHLVPGRPVGIVDGLLQLQLTRNAGAAFSFATGMTWVLTVVALAVVVVVVRSLRRLGSLPWALALGLLLGGALGNLTDRMLRAPGVGRGHVVDFIAYGHLFIGNVADIAIVVAALVVLLLGIRGTTLEGSRERAAASGREGDRG
jgi:signal peptidase II